jgi:hypothetical protein
VPRDNLSGVLGPELRLFRDVLGSVSRQTYHRFPTF